MDEHWKSRSKALWPVWVSFGFPLLLVVLNSTPISTNFFFVLAGIPVLLGVWACLGIWSLFLAIRQMRNHMWPQAAVSSVLPLAVIAAAVWLLPFIHLCNDLGDVMYFVANRDSYESQIGHNPRDGNPGLVIFNRGGMIWASRGFVYDESDEVIRDPSLQSAAWKAQANQTELSCGYYAQAFPIRVPFTHHWYLASFSC